MRAVIGKGVDGMKINSSEKGQALIVIALAAVALFGFAALAIDGSMVFSDRRHAQNAADTAALDAALSKTRGGSWQQEGLDRATSNGYNDNGTSNEVGVYNPPIDGNYVGNSQYIQVKITSHVNTFFARVIGFDHVTNKV
jgi:Flp pilus assembly protein TadG